MSGARGEQEALRALLGEAARAGAGAHLELDLLVAYSGGELDDEADRRVRDHLTGCRRCGERLLELIPLMRPDPAPADGVADLEIEAAWRRLRVPDGGVRAARSGWLPRALAAALALAAVILGLWALRLRHANTDLRRQVAGLSAPVANMPHLYLDGVTRGEEPAPGLFEVPASAGYFGVFIAVSDPLPADRYEVRFVDAAGREVLTVGGLVVSESGSLRLGLPRGLLPAGNYRVRLRGLTGGVWRPVTEYRLTLGYP